jgi:hypothetical protein
LAPKGLPDVLATQVEESARTTLYPRGAHRLHPAHLERPSRRPPRGDRTWRTFVRNHAKEVWSCDFLTQYTALFAVAYVFVIMEIDSRRIVHVNVTTNPTMAWVKQQKSTRSYRCHLDHFIFLTADHIRRVVREYVRYYNGARPSQAIHGIPDPYPELRQPPPMTGKLVALPVLGGVLHDDRLVA